MMVDNSFYVDQCNVV